MNTTSKHAGRREGFCGKMTKRRKSVWEALVTYVTLENSAGTRLTVKLPSARAASMAVGGIYTVGHVNKSMINIHRV